MLQKHSSEERFVMRILSSSSIYTAGELQQIQNILDRLKNQKEIERQKYKADNLLENREFEDAILVYHVIYMADRMIRWKMLLWKDLCVPWIGIWQTISLPGSDGDV